MEKFRYYNHRFLSVCEREAHWLSIMKKLDAARRSLPDPNTAALEESLLRAVEELRDVCQTTEDLTDAQLPNAGQADEYTMLEDKVGEVVDRYFVGDETLSLENVQSVHDGLTTFRNEVFRVK